MLLSQEQTNDFDDIKRELFRRYNFAVANADMFFRMGDAPRSARIWQDMASLLAPIADLCNIEEYDNEYFNKFDALWQDATAEFPSIYNVMRQLNVDYDKFWNGLDELEDFINNFLNEVKPNQKNSKDQADTKPTTESFEKGTQGVLKKMSGPQISNDYTMGRK